MGNLNKINIYVGKVGQAYVDKETAEQNYLAAYKNVSDVEDIINIAGQYNTQAQTILASAEDAQTLATQVRNTIETNISQYENDETIYNQLVSLLNRLNENDNDGNYKNGGNTTTAGANIEFINNLIAELNEITSLASALLSENQAYLNECETAKNEAIEIFRSYLPSNEEYQSNKSDEAESELINRLEEVANGLETAQETTENINNTSNQAQEEVTNIINGETPEPEPIDPEPIDNNKYFYVGTTKPTSLSEATVVEEYEAEQIYTNNSDERSKIYVLTNSDKTVTMDDPGLGGLVDQDDVDTTTISGYKIWSTYSKLPIGGGVKIIIS